MAIGLRPITTESTGKSAPIIGYFVSIIRADSPVTPDVGRIAALNGGALMFNEEDNIPLRYKGVMVSSTFVDLVKHRAALIHAIEAQGLKAVAMENDSAKPGVDVVESSFKMVWDASAYIGVIGHKYGQIPNCSKRNPDGLSLTQLEFNEARRIGRPVLLFIMGSEHPVRASDVETSPQNIHKLNAFREDAKRLSSDTSIHRVYKVFNDANEFAVAATQAIAELRQYLDEQTNFRAPLEKDTTVPLSFDKADPDPIPQPPSLYAEPSYIGSHNFVGRRAELEVLSDWVALADPHPILLFDAIGGSGKSMLTWEWTTKHSYLIRKDWAGRSWYSFYERGAVMDDFARHALAYITRLPLENFRKTKTRELSEVLLHHLKSRPWLLILDGLERVLVAYHRFDAAQVPDDVANQPTDQIAHRDPCTAIRPEDDDLLRALSAAVPSKILITSRLVPRVLLNPANQPIPGVRRVSLPGLRPTDAEALLSSCGVAGRSQAIQDYLNYHCDCHPLVTGVIAGLINNYLADKGNFDAWVTDPDGGGRLNLANLNLVQRRNHILRTALDSLPEKGRDLISILAFLSEAVDYHTLLALNPHLPPEPEDVKEPRNPELSARWKRLSDSEKALAHQNYESELHRRKEYERAIKARQESPEFLGAQQSLAQTVCDLERRGLLQYDSQSKRYDLHPVVRGIAAGGLRPEARIHYGQLVVDHYSQQAHSPYKAADSLEDFRYGFHVIRALLQMERMNKAYDAFYGDFSRYLRNNLEAYVEILSLVRPFFPHGWAALPKCIDEEESANLAHVASNCLYCIGENVEALDAALTVLVSRVRQERWRDVCESLISIAIILADENRLALDARVRLLVLELTTLINEKETLIDAKICRFVQLARMGQWEDAEAIWQFLPPRDDNWPKKSYDRGYAEACYAFSSYWRGTLTEESLCSAEELAIIDNNRRTHRFLLMLRGEWQLSQGQWTLASASLYETVRMARQAGLNDSDAETLLALAKFQIQKPSDSRNEAIRLENVKKPNHRVLAELWLAIGDYEKANEHALKAYKLAWADGEPYVNRYELRKARALLEQLGIEIPNLAPYDPHKDVKAPWEIEVIAALEKLRGEKEAEKMKNDSCKEREARASFDTKT